jgi:hypothetical protein
MFPLGTLILISFREKLIISIGLPPIDTTGVVILPNFPKIT